MLLVGDDLQVAEWGGQGRFDGFNAATRALPMTTMTAIDILKNDF